MIFPLIYLWTEYRKKLYSTLRHSFFLTIVVALLFIFAAMFPALNHHFTATFQHARYNLLINGSLTKSDLELILKKLEPFHPTYVGLYGGFVHKLSAGGRTLQGVINYYFNPEDFQKVQESYFSEGLLLQGSISHSNAWGIDYMTAKRLGVSIGDRVECEQTLVDNRGQITKVRQSGVIKAIYAPTNEVNGLITPIPSEVSSFFEKGGVVFTHIFLRAKNATPDALAMRLSSLPKSKEWLIEPVPQAFANGKLKVEQMFNRNLRYSTIWAALLIYAIFILREQFQRLEKRKKNLAVLFSLGLSEKRLYQILVFEQLVLNLSTGLLGIYLGNYLLQGQFATYVPRETFLFLLGYVFLIVFAIVVLSMIQLIYRLRRLDVARLLATE